MVDAVLKTAIWLAVALVVAGCTIGRLHASFIDMNKVETQVLEDAPPKPAAQLNFQWDF